MRTDKDLVAIWRVNASVCLAHPLSIFWSRRFGIYYDYFSCSFLCYNTVLRLILLIYLRNWCFESLNWLWTCVCIWGSNVPWEVDCWLSLTLTDDSLSTSLISNSVSNSCSDCISVKTFRYGEPVSYLWVYFGGTW